MRWNEVLYYTIRVFELLFLFVLTVFTLMFVGYVIWAVVMRMIEKRQ